MAAHARISLPILTPSKSIQRRNEFPSQSSISPLNFTNRLPCTQSPFPFTASAGAEAACAIAHATSSGELFKVCGVRVASRPSTIEVKVNQGATIEMEIPDCKTSSIKDVLRTSPRTACLLAVYKGWEGTGTYEPADPTTTIRPPLPLPFMWCIASFKP